MDWCLSRDDDGSFSPVSFHHGTDVRYVTPTLKFTNRPYRLWLDRIEASAPYLTAQLDWVERVNTALFVKFDGLYDG
ncbi:hypothetical protein SAMN05216299_12223 [Nitrosospira sp. Nsp14]|nr:hypothetical protein SAMN05216299_12223 [Nitrosospira sp. Nsp14]